MIQNCESFSSWLLLQISKVIINRLSYKFVTISEKSDDLSLFINNLLNLSNIFKLFIDNFKKSIDFYNCRDYWATLLLPPSGYVLYVHYSHALWDAYKV